MLELLLIMKRSVERIAFTKINSNKERTFYKTNYKSIETFNILEFLLK